MSQKGCQCYFWNNSVKRLPILIIFGRQHRRNKDYVNGYSFANLTLTLLPHYLVKYGSRILDIYNSEYIGLPVSHVSAQNIIARPQNIENLLSPGLLHCVECALQASISYIDFER